VEIVYPCNPTGLGISVPIFHITQLAWGYDIISNKSTHTFHMFKISKTEHLPLATYYSYYSYGTWPM